MTVCAGGIFGLGETLAQRWEMAQALKTLGVDAIPLNFLHPLPGTPLAHRPLLPPLEALKIVLAFRLTFPERSLIICGGRQVTLRSLAPLLFAAGADALMTGDYLTTRGRMPDDDRQMLADLGLELVQETPEGRAEVMPGFCPKDNFFVGADLCVRPPEGRHTGRPPRMNSVFVGRELF